MIDKAQVRLFNWFLKLLNTDMEQIGELDLEKLVLEANFYITGSLNPDAFDHASRNVEFLSLIDSQVVTLKDYLTKEILKKIQSELRKILEEILSDEEMQRTGVGRVREIASVTLCLMPTSDEIHVFHRLKTNLKNIVSVAKITFCKSLSSIPLAAIKICKECGNYFLHLSKRSKFYCNSKCASRAISRQRREKDPEGYRAKQREIMRRKYREKKAKELNKPVDKIKIQPRVTIKEKKKSKGT